MSAIDVLISNAAISTTQLTVLRRFGERCSDLSEEYILDPYFITTTQTFVEVLAALATGAGPQRTMLV